MDGHVSCALAISILYFGLKTKYSGLSIRLLISLILFFVFLSKTLMLKTAKSDLVLGPSTVMKKSPVTFILTTFCLSSFSQKYCPFLCVNGLNFSFFFQNILSSFARFL